MGGIAGLTQNQPTGEPRAGTASEPASRTAKTDQLASQGQPSGPVESAAEPASHGNASQPKAAASTLPPGVTVRPGNWKRTCRPANLTASGCPVPPVQLQTRGMMLYATSVVPARWVEAARRAAEPEPPNKWLNPVTITGEIADAALEQVGAVTVEIQREGTSVPIVSGRDNKLNRNGKKVGRPSSCTPRNIRRICAKVAKGVPLNYACKRFGIDPGTAARWLLRSREPNASREFVVFSQMYERAKAAAVEKRIACIDRIAEGGNVISRTTSVTKDGKTTTAEKFQQPQWMAAAWWLERVHSEQFGKSTKVEHSGTVRNQNVNVNLQLDLPDADAAQLLGLLSSAGVNLPGPDEPSAD